MPLHLMRSIAVLLTFALLNTSCGSMLEEIRPDALVAAPRPASATVEPPPFSNEWSGLFEDVDEVTLVAVPYAPRKLRVEDISGEEFKAFMLRVLRDIDFRKLNARQTSSPSHNIMMTSWWGRDPGPNDFLLTQQYLLACQREDPRSCLSLDPGAALTKTQKYRVALGIGMSRFFAGFLMELGDEARAMVDPSTLKAMLIGTMVSYLFLLANPDPVFTKALAAAATVVVTGMLGARTVYDVACGFRDMVRQVDAGRTYEDLAEAGRMYGQKLGASTARVLVMAVTALLNKGGAISKLSRFPKLSQGWAALATDTAGVLRLKSLGQVVGVKALAGGLYIAMAEAGGKVAGNVTTAANPTSGSGSAPVQAPVNTQSPGVTGYKSFDALKNAIGWPPSGHQWHHIVEQCRADIFGKEAVHNQWNVILLDEETHMEISAYYSRKFSFTREKTVREWLKFQSYEAQREFGLKTLRKFGVSVP